MKTHRQRSIGVNTLCSLVSSRNPWECVVFSYFPHLFLVAHSLSRYCALMNSYTRKNITNTSSIFTSMARKSRSTSPSTRDTTLTIRTRDPLPQYGIDTPIARHLTTTQADRCQFPGCSNTLPHQHPTAAGAKTAPSLEEYRKAGEAIRARWTEEQRRQTAENEASLRQLVEIEPKIGDLSINPHPPRGNDLTVQDQDAIIHGGATPAQYEAAGGMLLERQQRQDIVDNISCVTPIFTTTTSSTQPCTAPCPIQTPHNQGAYLQQGQVPRFWNARWGYSDPPRGIWEAWVRVERGRGRGWDEVVVGGFAGAHWWGGV